jgi:tetratricopeptide (TPR) repeat protein
MNARQEALGRILTSPAVRAFFGVILFAVVATATAYMLAGSGDTANSETQPQSNAKQSAAARQPTSSFGRFLAGRFAESQSDIDQAARLMAGVLEDHPENKDFLQQAFVLAVSAGHNKKAVELARRIDADGMKGSTARLVLVGEDFAKKDYAAALKRLSDAEPGGLGRYSLPIATAWAYVGQKKYGEALIALADLEKERGFTVMYQLHAGLINAAAGKPETALSHFKAVTESKKLDVAPVRVQRAALPVLQQLGMKDEVLALIDKQLEANVNSYLFGMMRQDIEKGRKIRPLAATPAEGLAEGLFNVATALPRNRAGNVVILYARLARMLRPDFPLASILIGDIMISRERFDDSVRAYGEVSKDSYYSWSARMRTADALYEAERLPEARKLLEAMADEEPKRFDALLKLGNHLRYKEHYKDAVKVYDRAFERIDAVKKRDWSLFYSRGIALERAKQWDRAEKDFLKALELSPDQPYVLNYLGYSWVERRKNLDKAKKMIESAVAQRRNDGYIVDSMGWVMYRLGDYKGAVKHLERAVQLRPHDPIINDHLGDAYWRVGRKYEARFQWRRALSFDPEKAERSKIEQKLEKGLGKPEIVEQDG